MITHAFAQLTPGVHWLSPGHETDRPILGVIAGRDATLIVDAGNSPAHAHCLLDEIAEIGVAPPAFLVLTHWHWDHVFGAATFDLPTVAHRETRRIVDAMTRLDWSDAALDQRVVDGTEIAFCRDMIKAELPDRGELTLRAPQLAFASEIEIDLGGLTCRIIHVGGDHAHDSSIVVVPEARVVFLGDCMYHDLHHGPDRYTTRVLFPLLDRLLACDADFYVPAHHDTPLTATQMRDEATLLRSIGRTVDEHGTDRGAILAALPDVLGTDLDDRHRTLADAFIAGIRLPRVSPLL